MLLTLPTELVELILRSCDPSAFLQLAFCNRTLYEIASTSRDLILHHLFETPGFVESLGSLPSTELWALFRRRAYKELWGAESHGERKLINVHGKVIDPRASTLDAAGPRSQVVLAFKGDGAVYVCGVQDGALSPQRRLESPGRRFGTVEVLHTAVGSDGVYVLHRLRPFIDQDLDTTHPFVKHALQTNSQGSIFLACHHLDTTGTKIYLYGFPDQKDYEPLALAVHNGRFAISWQHLSLSDDHHVVLYTSKDAGGETYCEDQDAESDWQVDCLLDLFLTQECTSFTDVTRCLI